MAESSPLFSLRAMADDSGLNTGNNIGKIDCIMFLAKTLHNHQKWIVQCFCMEHTGDKGPFVGLAKHTQNLPHLLSM